MSRQTAQSPSIGLRNKAIPQNYSLKNFAVFDPVEISAGVFERGGGCGGISPNPFCRRSRRRQRVCRAAGAALSKIRYF